MRKPSGKLWVWLVLLVAVLILLAGIVLVFSSAALQQKLLSQQPVYDAQTLYSRGVEQSVKGDFAAAEQSLEEALKKQDEATYRSQLAVVKYRLKKYEESIDLYQKLIDEGKDGAFAWNGIGNVHRDWSEVEGEDAEAHIREAIAAYEKTITLNKEYIAAYSNLALVLEGQGKVPEAIQILDKGIAETGSKELVQIKERMLQN